MANFKFFLIIWLFAIIACNNSSQHLVGRFYLKHDQSGKSISYKVDDTGDFIELIRGAFGPIGFDNNYVIVERSRYEYLIIPVSKEIDYDPEKHIIGPLSLKEFEKQKQKLKIEADFTIESN